MIQIKPEIVIKYGAGGNHGVVYGGKDFTVDSFIHGLPESDKERVRASLERAFNSCAIPGTQKSLRVFHGIIVQGTMSKKRKNNIPCTKLFVEYPDGYPIFIMPTQIKESQEVFFSELTACIRILLAMAPLEKPVHTCGEQTEAHLGFRG